MNNHEPTSPSFTPAPWHSTEGTLVYAGSQFVADCEFGGYPSGDPRVIEQQANARLIAAAPELHEVVMFAAEEINDILHDESTILQDLTGDLLKQLLPMLNRVLEKVGGEASHD